MRSPSRRSPTSFATPLVMGGSTIPPRAITARRKSPGYASMSIEMTAVFFSPSAGGRPPPELFGQPRFPRRTAEKGGWVRIGSDPPERKRRFGAREELCR